MKKWIPHELRLWIATIALVTASWFAGFAWGSSGDAWGGRLRPTVALPSSHAPGERWDAPPAQNFRLILRNNALVYASLACGLATAGLWTCATLAWVVAMLGFVAGVAAKAHVPWRIAFAMFAPHGFLEVLAFAFAAVVGLRCLVAGFGYLRDGRLPVEKGEPAAWALRLAIGLVLVVAAAALEAYVTPLAIRAEIERAFLQGVK